MNVPPVLQSNKALPSLAKDMLPAVPPPADPPFSSSPPPPPPKFLPDSDTSLPSNDLRPPPIDVALSNEFLGQGTPSTFFPLPRLSHAYLLGFRLDLDAASGPLSSPALSIPASPSPDSRAKRANPLVDLIDTEKLYVDQLAGVIRVG
jgi:hypothetical protein